MSIKALVPVADGSEEIEAVCIIDTLRRAGAEVDVASVDNVEISASRGVVIHADKPIEDCVDVSYDLIALPGGMPGAEHLRDSAPLTALLKTHTSAGKLYGAICASPAVVLARHGLLKGKTATCHPAFVQSLENAQRAEQRVVVDGNCVTSRGPGTALEFALTLVGLLYGKGKADSIAAAMVMPESR
jgi:4-methyl-5(b-hydroxyethyl)-thiazole monophosphate biosynthesis